MFNCSNFQQGADDFANTLSLSIAALSDLIYALLRENRWFELS